MRIFTAILAATLLLALGQAHAQLYRWVDKDGKVRYSDVPPTGAKTTKIKEPPRAPPAPKKAAAAKDGAAKDGAAKAAPKGPLTPAEQEQAFRERQLKAKEEADKAAKAQAEADQLKQNCAAAQESIRSIERGGRIATVNANGETEFLNDAQKAARLEQAQAAAAQACK